VHRLGADAENKKPNDQADEEDNEDAKRGAVPEAEEAVPPLPPAQTLKDSAEAWMVK